MLSAILENSGGFLLTGEVGSGKSRVSNQLGAYLAAAGHSVVAIDGPEIIAADIGVGSLERQLMGTPLPPNRALVLIVDAAERLHNRTLQSLLSWLAVARSRGDPLRLMLVGRPALRELLDQTDENLSREEIRWRFELAPLDCREEKRGLAFLWKHVQALASAESGSIPAVTRTSQIRPPAAPETARRKQQRSTLSQSTSWTWAIARSARYTLATLAAIVLLWTVISLFDRGADKTSSPGSPVQVTENNDAPAATHPAAIPHSVIPDFPPATVEKEKAAPLDRIEPLAGPPPSVPAAPAAPDTFASKNQPSDDAVGTTPQPTSPAPTPQQGLKTAPLDRIKPLAGPPPSVPAAPATPDALASKNQPSDDAVGTTPQPASPVPTPQQGLKTAPLDHIERLAGPPSPVPAMPAAPDALASKNPRSNDAVGTILQPTRPVPTQQQGLALLSAPRAQSTPRPPRSLEDKTRADSHRSPLTNRTGSAPKQPPTAQIALRTPPVPKRPFAQSDGYTDQAAQIPAAGSGPLCQPYVSSVNYVGTAVHVSGMACHDGNGHWWLMNQQE